MAHPGGAGPHERRPRYVRLLRLSAQEPEQHTQEREHRLLQETEKLEEEQRTRGRQGKRGVGQV